jgi:hypothetical protein
VKVKIVLRYQVSLGLVALTPLIQPSRILPRPVSLPLRPREQSCCVQVCIVAMIQRKLVGRFPYFHHVDRAHGFLLRLINWLPIGECRMKISR